MLIILNVQIDSICAKTSSTNLYSHRDKTVILYFSSYVSNMEMSENSNCIIFVEVFQ